MATKKSVSKKGGAAKAGAKSASAGAPRIKASHGSARGTSAAPKGGRTPALKAARGAPAAKKAQLSAPKRAAPRPRAAPPEPSSESRELALVIAGAGMDKKAIGIEILDVSGKVDYAEFLVVMTGRSDRHVHAIAQGIEEEVKRKQSLHALSVEGLTAATWVLIDFGDVVVHVFQEEARSLYDIEGLWIDASRLPVPDGEGPSRPEAF